MPAKFSDIWRGYWVQRLLWDVNGSLSFANSTMNNTAVLRNFRKIFHKEPPIVDQLPNLIHLLATWTSPAVDLGTRVVDLMKTMAQAFFFFFG